MFCASVAYPAQPGGRFDFAYFAHTYVPLFARLLGANCVRFEVQRPLTTPGAPPPAYQGVAHFWVQAGEEFGSALEQHGPEIYADIPRFTDIEPVRYWSEVVSQEEGAP